MSTAPNTPDDILLAHVGSSPEGMAIHALEAAVGNVAQRRTLQRQLARLVKEGRLVREGAARAVRYRLAPTQASASAIDGSDGLRSSAERYVPITAEGAEIKAYVRQPQHRRRPVTYDMALLEIYEPNRSTYLPATLREQLHLMGSGASRTNAPAGTLARDVLARLLIDLSWSSSRLEGNTYSLLDTQRLIEQGAAAEGKNALETQMILNHKAAIEYLVGEPSVAVDAPTVIALHALLSDGLLQDPLSVGRLRRHAVDIGGSVFLPVALPQQLAELFDVVLRTAAAIRDPFEQAFFLMVHLPYLQPFADVNKRVSRLAANIPLVRCNLCPLSFIDVPTAAYIDGTLGVYELQRVELLRDVFVDAYERSCQRYAAVRQQLVPPDTFRLRHRDALTQAVQAIVRSGTPMTGKTSIAKNTPRTVAAAERQRFVELVERELAALHEGNAVRFGLRPLEWQAWRDAQRPAPVTRNSKCRTT